MALDGRPQEYPRRLPIDTSTIPGWGVDADPSNDPTWPMRDREKDDGPGMNWMRPPQQVEATEILRSIEHERLPAVFGSALPPTGLSGALRRFAFRWSESRWTHWLALMAADRINVVEGVVADLGRGKPPNIVAELGLPAAWKYDRQALMRRTAVGVAITAAAVGLIYLLVRDRD